MVKRCILHQGILKMKLHLGHITDEERSICAEDKTQVQNYFLVSPDTLINACLWAC